MWRRGLGLLLCVLLAACGAGEPLYQQESYVFGTRVQLTIQGLDEPVARKHAQAVLAELDRQHARLHAWQPSEITRLNAALAQGQTYPLDVELLGLLRRAQHYSRLSDGLFNPAVGHLVESWGFHRDTFEPVVPDPQQLQQWVNAAPTMDDLLLDGHVASSRNRAVSVDLGGFAKGWALDAAAAYLRGQRVRNALINIGGNVLALGKKGQEPWVVAIQHPRQPGVMASLALADGEAIGTSGDYQRFFELDGVRYSHMIDPRTGQPARHLQAATVVAPASLEAGSISDALTKPLFIGGKDTAKHFAARFGVRDVLLVAADGSVFVSPSMQQRLHWIERPKHIYRLY